MNMTVQTAIMLKDKLLRISAKHNKSHHNWSTIYRAHTHTQYRYNCELVKACLSKVISIDYHDGACPVSLLNQGRKGFLPDWY